MQDLSDMQNLPQQNCHLLRLPTELRFEICRFAFQHDLDVIKSTPYSYNSTTPPFRGALALLHTCRTLRGESIDAIEPLARASRRAIAEELLDLPISAMLNSCFRRAATAEELFFDEIVVRIGTGLRHIEKACDLLALARRANEYERVGREKN
jgi:hypothetical protein